MRRTLILTLAVLACALAICTTSLWALNRAVDEAERLERLAVQAERENRPGDAGALLLKLSEYWDAQANLMELLASHDALHDVGAAITEARICLECGDHDDFLRTMSEVRAGLEHLKDEEAVRWSNLY